MGQRFRSEAVNAKHSSNYTPAPSPSNMAIPGQSVADTTRLRILIVLDITGSMSDALTAVKSAIKGMVRLVASNRADGPSLAFAFITFTGE